MGKRSLPPFWVIFGVGVVVVASLGFILASLGASVGKPTATLFTPTQVPVATSVPTAVPTTVSVVESSSPLPTEIPKAAPDFTLDRADGGAFTLSEQLAHGPVVLVFFQKCG